MRGRNLHGHRRRQRRGDTDSIGQNSQPTKTIRGYNPTDPAIDRETILRKAVRSHGSKKVLSDLKKKQKHRRTHGSDEIEVIQSDTAKITNKEYVRPKKLLSAKEYSAILRKENEVHRYD